MSTTNTKQLPKYDQIIYCRQEDFMAARYDFVETLGDKAIIKIATLSDQMLGIHCVITYQENKKTKTVAFAIIANCDTTLRSKRTWKPKEN